MRPSYSARAHNSRFQPTFLPPLRAVRSAAEPDR